MVMINIHATTEILFLEKLSILKISRAYLKYKYCYKFIETIIYVLYIQ